MLSTVSWERIYARHNPDEGNVFCEGYILYLNLRLEVGKLMFPELTFSAYFVRKEDFQCNVSSRIGHQVPMWNLRRLPKQTIP